MPDKKYVSSYFADNAKQWLVDGYTQHGYNYPLGLHRNRVVIESVQELSGKIDGLKVLDIGCGGGHLLMEFAKRGADCSGVDQNSVMLGQAKDRFQEQEKKDGKKIAIKFTESDLESFSTPDRYDVITAMGVIGYLQNDDILFSQAAKHLKPGGIFLVSCRNRLLNLYSVSDRTKTELARGTIGALIEEYKGVLENSTIDLQAADIFLEQLQKKCGELREQIKDFSGKVPADKKSVEQAESKSYTMPIEARQHSPDEILVSGKRNGFSREKCVGVHPHLLPPRLERALPPGFYSQLSGSLEVFEEDRVSQLWSSTLINVFRKD